MVNQLFAALVSTYKSIKETNVSSYQDTITQTQTQPGNKSNYVIITSNNGIVIYKFK